MNYNNSCLRKIVVSGSVRNLTWQCNKIYWKPKHCTFHRHVHYQYSVLNDICIIKWSKKWPTGSFLIIYGRPHFYRKYTLRYIIPWLRTLQISHLAQFHCSMPSFLEMWFMNAKMCRYFKLWSKMSLTKQ